MARINLSAPLVQFYYELSAMFKRDPDINIDNVLPFWLKKMLGFFIGLFIGASIGFSAAAIIGGAATASSLN